MGWITKPLAPRGNRGAFPATRALTLIPLIAGCALLLAGSTAAYPQYSVNGDATNCRGCHGDFRSSPYTSLTDGESWGDDLHDVHRNVMLDKDCDTCHSSGPGKFPVLIGNSAGGVGLDPIGCSGCHGRAEDGIDPGNSSVGFGAGLRQHHWRADVTDCRTCHLDADPELFTPVEEDFLPPYYADSDPDHPLIPSDPCNLLADSHPEDYAASTLGLDNDGDDLYDEADVIACPEPGKTLMLASGLGFVFALARRRR